MLKVHENFYQLKCTECDKFFDEHETCTTCKSCNAPLDVEYNYEFIKKRLNIYALKNSPISALKYLTFYPIIDLDNIVTLNEGGTPLHHCKNLGSKYELPQMYVKNEGANPTGVFKDRGTLVEVTKAKEMGAKAVCLASTGNMAASVSAYCSIAKIPCYVLVPEGTPSGKLAQSLCYGARIIQVRGDYSTCAKLAEEMAERHGFYLAGDYVFRLEGQKSQAYEIAEQLGWKAPDYLLCPVGVGTNLAAIHKGFVELKKLELIDKLPKIVAVQAKGSNAIVRAFKAKQKRYSTLDKVDTVCSAVAVTNPFDGNKLLDAIYMTKGFAIELEDEEVLEAQQLLAKEEAIFVEPSGALPIAAIMKLQAKKFFKKTDVVVCVATGTGLKDPKSAVKILPDPPTIDPETSEVDNYLKNKLYLLKAEGNKNKAKVLWKKIPDKKQLKALIEKEFAIKVTAPVLELITKRIQYFETKGKTVTKQDLQNIIENALDDYTLKDKQLEIIDFSTNTAKYKKAEANIKIRFGKQTLIGQAKGVGTVDAIITAIKEAIKDHDELEMSLTDYNVEIFTGGVDATVKVEIKAQDKHGNKVIAHDTSPDVIVASVSAFEKCYNLLYHKYHV
jgi:threonine synthase